MPGEARETKTGGEGERGGRGVLEAVVTSVRAWVARVRIRER